eukprot:jgi/Chrzof1/10117/Cz04g29110.t1
MAGSVDGNMHQEARLGYCASYGLRKQVLYNDMSRYLCCQGSCPCSGRMGEQNCPEFCLCMEVFFCFAQSVASTRWTIQDELQIQTTDCDNCIIGTMVCMQYFACICSIVACLTGSDEINDLAQLLDCVADILWCTVCGCMQTQAKAELDVRDAGGAGATPAPAQAPGVQMIPMGGAPPPHQQQYGGYPQHGNYPPPSGYPPQGNYPQPGAYPPQPGYPVQGGGYPPQGNYPQSQQQMYR